MDKGAWINAEVDARIIAVGLSLSRQQASAIAAHAGTTMGAISGRHRRLLHPAEKASREARKREKEAQARAKLIAQRHARRMRRQSIRRHQNSSIRAKHTACVLLHNQGRLPKEISERTGMRVMAVVAYLKAKPGYPGKITRRPVRSCGYCLLPKPMAKAPFYSWRHCSEACAKKAKRRQHWKSDQRPERKARQAENAARYRLAGKGKWKGYRTPQEKARQALLRNARAEANARGCMMRDVLISWKAEAGRVRT